MKELFLFVLEKTIVNSVAIIPSLALISYIGGPFLRNVGANCWARVFIYCFFGVAAGIWSYSAFDAPNRSLELIELVSLSSGMSFFSLILVAPIVFLKNRNKNERR